MVRVFFAFKSSALSNSDLRCLGLLRFEVLGLWFYVAGFMLQVFGSGLRAYTRLGFVFEVRVLY